MVILKQNLEISPSASLVAQTVKNLPAMWETWVRSLDWEGMAPLSSVPAWRLPWTEEPGGLQSMGSQSRTRLSDSPAVSVNNSRKTSFSSSADHPGVCPLGGWRVSEHSHGLESSS